MNFKTTQLSKQAAEYADKHALDNGGFYPCYTEKFVELIVRECIGVVDYDDGATHVRELLLEHFGVKE
jgi:hypothetical protein